MSIKLQQPYCEQQCHLRSKNQSHNYSIETITNDRVEIQVISRIVMLGSSYSLTTIHTRHLVSLHCGLEIHLSQKKRSVRQPIQIDYRPHDDPMTGSI